MNTYCDLIDQIVHDGIVAARHDYREPRDSSKKAGSIAGFEACRGRVPSQLSALLEEAHLDTQRARRETREESDDEVMDYWYWRCRELEIEWVCNVVSAVLMNEGFPVIIPPTARGVMKAAEIVGIMSDVQPESLIPFHYLKDRVTETWAAPMLSREEANQLLDAVEKAYHRPVEGTDLWFCQVCRKIRGHAPTCPGARFDWEGVTGPLVEFVDGRRVVCWICKKPIEPDRATRALCATCATGGGLGPYT